MPTNDLHREDLKAALRKSFGSLNAFEQLFGLPHNSVAACLRRPHQRAEIAVAKALHSTPSALWPSRYNDDGTRKQPQPRAAYLNSPACTAKNQVAA